MNKQRIFFTILLIAVFTFLGLRETNNKYYITGKTMGTTYSVSVWGKTELTQQELQSRIDLRLQDINNTASTWIKTSEITKFNTEENTLTHKVNPFLIHTILQSQEIHTKSKGAFDMTIGKLISLWGFDAEGRVTKAPSTKTLRHTLTSIGADKIIVNANTLTISKTNEDLKINLSAIAKGGGVDAIAYLLQELGFTNFLVEIGGEVFASGTKIDGASWRVGIETPNATSGQITKIIPLTNQGLATSGDYRNYFEEQGRRYSHIINPQTGKPIKHKLASASVLHDSTAMADGWATAMMVLGEEQGMKIAKQENIAVFMLVRDGDTFKTLTSPAWEILTGE